MYYFMRLIRLKALIRPCKALSRLNNKPYKSLYGLIFGAILSNLGNLEPFWNHFGTVFGNAIFDHAVFGNAFNLELF